MARVSSVAQTSQTFSPLAAVVRKLSVTGRYCGQCGSSEIRPSTTRNALDILLACVFLVPYRCRDCRERFYRLWRPGFERPSDPPIAPLLVLPARSGTLRLDIGSSPQIEPEPLPLESQHPQLIQLEAESIDEKPPLPVAASGSILILESDLSIRKLLRRLLERRGYAALDISSIEEIGDGLRDGRADLLVIDVAVLGSDGVQALVALACAHPSLKILALSAESLQGSEIPGRFLALPKPFPLDSFVDSVDRLLGR
jgi:CheY-like chemotaxis protein